MLIINCLGSYTIASDDPNGSTTCGHYQTKLESCETVRYNVICSSMVTNICITLANRTTHSVARFDPTADLVDMLCYMESDVCNHVASYVNDDVKI